LHTHPNKWCFRNWILCPHGLQRRTHNTLYTIKNMWK